MTPSTPTIFDRLTTEQQAQLADWMRANLKRTTDYPVVGERLYIMNTPEVDMRDDFIDLYMHIKSQPFDRVTTWTVVNLSRHQGKVYASMIEREDGKSTWRLRSATKAISEREVEEWISNNTNVKPNELDLTHLDKLILEDETKQEIIAVLKQHRMMNKIFVEWGLEDIIEYGRSMSMLFYGPPGTGKTWAGNCIAKAMGRELMVITAAEIQTSEPGGANRNIVAAFEQAKKTKSVLFFDECDSLITDRKHVGIILASEINSLLTALEKYEGVVIFATNRADTLDPAMERRISLMVEFKNPDQATRVDIWKMMLPAKMPLEPGLTPEKLAKFDLTGGYIKNVLLNAARYAATEDSPYVSKKHFAKAIKRVTGSKGLMGSHSSRDPQYQQVTKH